MYEKRLMIRVSKQSELFREKENGMQARGDITNTTIDGSVFVYT